MINYAKFWLKIGLPFVLIAVSAMTSAARDRMCFERFTTTEGLPSARVSAVCEDTEGVIWIATWNGLCQWQDGELTPVKTTADGKHLGRMLQLQPLQDGTISFLDSDRNWHRYDPHRRIFLPMSDSVAVYERLPRRCRYSEDNEGAHFVRRGVTYHIPYDKGTNSEKQLRCYYEDRRGQIWLSFNNSLYRIWFEATPFCYFRDWMLGRYVPFQASVRSLYTLSDNRLVAGTKNARLFGLDRASIEVPGSIYDMVEDSHHRLWMALRDSGLFYFSDGSEPVPAFENWDAVGLHSPFSLFLADDVQRLWVGTWNRGVRILDVSGERPVLLDTLHFENLVSVRHIMRLSDGRMAVCSTHGLHIFTADGKLVVSSPTNLNVLYAAELPSHEILFSTMDFGLYRLTCEGRCVTEQTLLFDDRIVAMIWGAGDVLYLVSDERLYLYHPTAGTYDVLNESDFGEVISFSEATVTIRNDSLLLIGASSGLLEVNLNQLPIYLKERSAKASFAFFGSATNCIIAALVILLVLALVFVVRKRRQSAVEADMDADENGAALSDEPLKLSVKAPILKHEDQQFIADVKRVMTEVIGQRDVDVNLLAEKMGMHKNSFYAKCSRVLHTTPAALLQDMRIDYARQLLEQGDISVKRVAVMSGFKDPKYFARVFRAKMGVLPSQYGGKSSEEVENEPS
ncbi:MAG: helix-turn-helix domain-containing protein [Bacteroidales bacterium]|nr:helix-turn-helix domain-containing protein [Bacteroidales bacterium]